MDKELEGKLRYVEEELIVLPPRSRLYSLPPIGIGTPMVESLTGYVARLATTHKVHTGTLFGREIAPLINKPYIIGRQPGGFSKSVAKAVQAINGLGVMAEDAIKALAQLTLRNDLSYLTLLTWKEVFSYRFLFHSHRQWCGLCYESWKTTEQPLYEPLLWSLKSITVCPVHASRLSQRCPNCQNMYPVLAERSRPGYCAKCGQWLGQMHEKVDKSEPSRDEIETQVWIATMIGEILAVAPHLLAPPSMVVVGQKISQLIRIEGSRHRKEFCHAVGLAEKLVGNWNRGSTKIRIDNGLRFCFGCRISLLQLLSCHAPLAKVPVPVLPPPSLATKRRAAWRSFDQVKIKAALEESLATEIPPPSVKSLAKRLGYHETVLFKYFSSLAKQIARRHKTYKQECSMQYVAKRKQEIRETVQQLLAQDIYPSWKTVSQQLSYGGKLLNLELAAIRQELGLKGKL